MTLSTVPFSLDQPMLARKQPYRFMIPSLLLLVLACAPQETETTISGQVFVVTRSRVNVKLGLVSIRAISASALNTHITSTHATTQERIESLLQDIADIRVRIEEREALFRQAKQDEAVEQIERFLTIGRLEPVAAPASGQIRDELTQLEQRLKSMEGSAKTAREDMFAAEYYWREMPEGLQGAKTDADGLFSMKVKSREPFVIVARATREIPLADVREEYYWRLFRLLCG